MGRTVPKPYHGMNLRDAIRCARSLGCRVSKHVETRGGHIHFMVGEGEDYDYVKQNCRRKDASRAVTAWLISLYQERPTA